MIPVNCLIVKWSIVRYYLLEISPHLVPKFSREVIHPWLLTNFVFTQGKCHHFSWFLSFSLSALSVCFHQFMLMYLVITTTLRFLHSQRFKLLHQLLMLLLQFDSSQFGVQLSLDLIIHHHVSLYFSERSSLLLIQETQNRVKKFKNEIQLKRRHCFRKYYFGLPIHVMQSLLFKSQIHSRLFELLYYFIHGGQVIG